MDFKERSVYLCIIHTFLLELLFKHHTVHNTKEIFVLPSVPHFHNHKIITLMSITIVRVVTKMKI